MTRMTRNGRPFLEIANTRTTPGFLGAFADVWSISTFLPTAGPFRNGWIPITYFYLISRMLPDGFKVLLRHPRLVGLFLEAITDNLLAKAPVQKVRDTQPDDLPIPKPSRIRSTMR